MNTSRPLSTAALSGFCCEFAITVIVTVSANVVGSTFHITTLLALAAVHPARQLCGASPAANTYSRAGPYEPRAFRKTEDSSAGFPALVRPRSRRALTARSVRGLI